MPMPLSSMPTPQPFPPGCSALPPKAQCVTFLPGEAIAVRPHLGLPGRGARLSSGPAYSILSKCLLRVGVQRHIQAKETAAPPGGLSVRARSGRSRRQDVGGSRAVSRHRQCAGHARWKALSQSEIEECETKTFRLMAACGLTLRPMDGAMVRRGPQDFERLFPGTGGAIYGRAPTVGWRHFSGRGCGRGCPGLYFAGGSVHPGPGVPMAALSGQLASEALLADLASMKRFHPMVTRGGMSMRSAPTTASD